MERTNYKSLKQVEDTVNRLLKKEWKLSDGKSVILTGYVFAWDKATKRFGRCQYKRSFERGKISLSKRLVETNLDNGKQIYDTIMHELAHAIVWEVYKYHGHGPKWKWIAKEIGANPERCYDSQTVKPVPGVAKYKVECKNCNMIHYWQRKPRYNAYICNKCGEKVEVQKV